MKSITDYNGFYECIDKSHKAADMPFWEECYRKAFPDMLAMLDHRQDGDHQRQGIDRSIIMPNSKQFKIDEKVRFRNKNGIVYRDIALERWSVWNPEWPEDRWKLGWVVKALLCDYIAYAIAPLGVCYLLPVIQLQAAWRDNEAEWSKRKPIDALNHGYITRSYPVEPGELFAAMGRFLRLHFEPYEITNENMST